MDSIRVGNRYREELGDVDALAESIARVGLLQPITITPDGVLVCGQRRLEAIKQLGHHTTKVWVRTGISEGVQHLLALQHENTTRKPLTVVESSKLYREIKALLAEDAARRKSAAQFSTHHQPRQAERAAENNSARRDGGGQWPPPSREAAKARTQAARLVTGKASYKVLEAVSALERIRDDTEQRPQIREHAAAALERIKTGAPARAAYELVRAEIMNNPYARSRPPSSTSSTDAGFARTAAVVHDGASAPLASNSPYRPAGTVREFLLTINQLDGWADGFDPDIIGRQLDDGGWDTFDRVLDEFGRFAVVARAARAAGDANSGAGKGTE
ncbi:ParB/RepB/Spo0J family partition protein [Isoptericola sp. NPDC019482]|uniref:ParB/RepB/Spo0J family partition protein n=1 Tax=Isoptericola sp. NPDC019482 TaxID=3154688 RepID=UPI003472EEF6